MAIAQEAPPRDRIPFGREETVNIFPSQVTTEDWAGTEKALIQDLNDMSLYQEFSAKNSAYVPQSPLLTPEPTLISPVDENVASGTTATSSDTVAPTEEPAETIDPTSTTDTAPEPSPTEAAVPEASGEEEVVPAPTEPDPSPTESTTEEHPPAEEVSLFDSAGNLFRGVFARVTRVFPFAQQSVTSTPPTAEEPEDEAAAEETSDEPSEETAESAVGTEEVAAEPGATTTDATNTDMTEAGSDETVPEQPGTTTSDTAPEAPLMASTETVPTSTAATEQEIATSGPTTPTAPASTATTTGTSVEDAETATSTERVEGGPVQEIRFSDFSTAELASGQFITGVQLRISLAGQLEEPLEGAAPYLEVLYGSSTEKRTVGTVLLEDEVSNAVNGGYYLFALPQINDVAELQDQEVVLRYHGEAEALDGMYLDALWVELNTKVVTKEDIAARGRAQQLGHLKLPEITELMSDQLNFRRNETPGFNLRYSSQRNVLVRGFRSLLGRPLARVESVELAHRSFGPSGITPEITVTDDGLISITVPENARERLRPGQYEVTLSINEGGYVSEDTFSFQWGILSINPNKTEYALGETAQLSIGALTPNGHTICHANLDLYITAPNGHISKASVDESGKCNGNNVIDVPDFSALYEPTMPGEYSLYLERLDRDGNVLGFTSDTFHAVAKQSIAIERNGPTRIYPPAPYPMTITVVANESFSGTLTERVPADFRITSTTASVERDGDWQLLTWDLSLLPGMTESVSYTFDAPDLSPYLYELGPASLAGKAPASGLVEVAGTSSTATGSVIAATDGTQTFTEHRQWQIASDAVGNMILFWADGSSIPADWTCLSCGSGTFYQRFAMGSSTYNNTGGTATHSHTGDGTVFSTTDAFGESGSGSVAPIGHSHTYTPGISTESNLPIYRQLRVIQYTAAAGEPPTVPAGAIGIFDMSSSSLPAGWNRYAAQDGYYIYGEDTPGTTGGSNTHAHSISGTTGASQGAGTRNRGGGSSGPAASDLHTHTVSGSTASDNHEPPYVEVLLAELSSDAAAPNGLIAMWTEDVDGGWLDVSSSPGDTFNGKFIKPAASYGASGGASTHTPADLTSLNSSIPNLTEDPVRAGTAGADDQHIHTVQVTNFSDESNLPPYVTAVFGKRQGTNPVYDQTSSWWYTNEDAQTPTDPWPGGVSDLIEREPITATSTPVKDNDRIRLRMNVGVTNATSTAGTAFKLQFATSSVCSAASNWQTVGDTASSTVWRGYDNSSVSDHSTLGSTLLASSTVSETYEENGYATSTPNEITVDNFGEWDFVLEHNGAEAGATYCFRMVEEDGTTFLSYSHYPQLLTNRAPAAPALEKLFDNEKTASTTPWFEFSATDAEGEDIHYEIEVDDNHDFGSPVIDKDTITDSSQFENQVFTADKEPFNQGELIRFTSETTLNNGTTYYWRVRAQDPDGSDAWGQWSTIRSFTVDTSLTASAWFQTTDEQFQTNTLASVGTTGSDSVDMDTGTAPDVSILDSFATGNTRTVSDGNARVLVVGIHSEDSGTNVDVDTVTYGGQTLTEVRDEQVGTGFSNGMWVGYLDEAGIAAATGETITPTWNGGTPDEAVLYSSVVLENVDQTDPVPDWSANSASSVSTIQPTTTIGVADGDMAVYFTVSGLGGETHTPAAGYTEGTEEDGNSVAANAYKAIGGSGTEQPTADWTNTQNRLAIVALTAQKTTSGTMLSTPIDFADGSLGTAWDSLAWNDTETSGDISYQIQYRTEAGAWSLIPDSDLSGNSSGFDTSPVSLLGLNTDTYNDLRLVANFTDSGGSPSLEDWTVNWGYRVETPSISELFPNEKTGTTTPTFAFTTTDPQNNDLTYQIQWSTDNAFTASTTRTSDTDAGFTNADSGADTDPFNSGDSIRFTIQPADALADNTTYWWRVRAKDTTGADAYSFWTDPQSFTVATDTVVSTWFQTTEEQFNTNILSGSKALASDEVTVATTATEAMIVYGQGTENTPRYRQWDGTSWGSEGELSDIGAPLRWAVVRAGTTREEYVAATVGTDNDVNAQVFATGEWTNLQEMTTSMGDTTARGFDVAYETNSGDALVVYCDGDDDPSYRVWNGASWSAANTIVTNSTDDCRWLELASDPTSDEIVMVVRDAAGSEYEGLVWNGSSWGNSNVFGAAREATYSGISLEYEDSGDQAVAVVPASGGGPNRMTYATWNGTTWTTNANEPIDGRLYWGSIARNAGTDDMVLCYINDNSDVQAIRWTGTAWTGDTELTANVNAVTDPAFSCVYQTTAGNEDDILAIYSNTAASNYRTYTTTWSGETQVNTIGDAATMQLARTGDGTILSTFFDDPNDSLLFSSFDGSGWSGTETLEDNASVDSSPYGQPYFIAPRNSGSEGTTIVSPGIEFTDGTGPFWERFSWVDTTPGTSEILYQVQYQTSTGTWAFIPDSDLPGNESGTSTSPVDLSGLNVNTYDTIRPYATLSCDGSGNCPRLMDWTVEWAEGITISGTLQQYDQTTDVTAGSVAVAVNGTLQTGKTGTVSGGSWSISNVTTFPGDVVTVFLDGAAAENEAVGVTRYDGSGNITGLQLFERHLTLGSDDATSTPLTNTDIGGYDVDNDEDVFMDLAGSTLTACADAGCGDVELFINASTTYAPGGRLVTHDLENNGVFTAGSFTHELSGSWQNAATTTMTGSSVVFAATSTTESIDTSGAPVASFNHVTFGTTTGSGTWTLVSPFDVDGDLTVARGTLARAAASITVAGDLSTGANGFWTGRGTTTFDGADNTTWADQNPTLQNTGRVVIDGNNKVVTLAGNVAAHSLTVGANDTLDASPGGHDITVFDSWLNRNNFVPRSGTVVFAATSTGKEVTTGGDAFFDLSFNGVGGGWSFTESNVGATGDLTVATGTVTLPTGTTTIGGSFDATGGSFAHNNGTLLFTSGGAETITFNGDDFTNVAHNLTFDGGGSWTLADTHATATNDVRISQGAVTFASGTVAIGGTIVDQGGSFAGGGGTVRFYSSAAETVTAGGSSFDSVTFDGTGSWSFSDTNVDADGTLSVLSGSVTLPGGTLTLGGSYQNAATVTAASGTVRFDSADGGETVDFGGSSLNDVSFDSPSGGWTITAPATTTGSFTLASSSSFTLASGEVLSVGGDFRNRVGGASTTWTGSTLSLESGNYSINEKDDTGDAYDTLRVKAGADIAMWNSVAGTYDIDPAGSLYSQDHNATDGDLYIFGSYERGSGTEHWSYATDFDGGPLGTSSARQADVRLAGGASVSLTGSTFSLLGTSSASTTVANQGSGTYTVSVSGGTTTAQYYEFSDLGGSGLSLLSGTVVPQLGNGSYEPAAAGGAGLTLSSSTIDANPNKQIFNVRFATTTGISAFNVAQTDGTPGAYWWFRDGSGNLYGEDFDNDTGDPGSVRFDDSSLVLTISGTVYADGGSTPLGAPTCDDATNVVRIVVDGDTSYSGSCSSADGSYSISGVTVVGDPTLTVYLDNAPGGQRGSVITRTPTANITDMDIYTNRVMVRNEDEASLSIENLAVYDESDDTDLRFTAATTTSPDSLTLRAGNELHVFASSTFTPGGVVTLNGNAEGNSYDGTLYLQGDATFNAFATSTLTIGGRLELESGASFDAASTTVLMNATTTGKSITAPGEITFSDLLFNGSGGSWNLGADIRALGDVTITEGTVTGTGDITLLNGSLTGDGVLSLGGGTTTLDRTNTLGGSSDWTFYDLVLGSGTDVGTTTPLFTGTTTVSGGLIIENAHFFDARGSVWDLAGSGTVFTETGTFLEGTSTIRYSGSGADVLDAQYYHLDINAGAGSPTYTATGMGLIVDGDLTVGGEAASTFDLTTNDPSLDVDGDLIIRNNGTLSASDSNDLTVAGSYDNDGTFTGNGGTFTFDGSGTATIAAGGSSFDDVVVDGTGDWTLTEHATATGDWTLTDHNTFTVNSGQSVAVGGEFWNGVAGAATTWSGSTLRLFSDSLYTVNTSTTTDTYGTLDIDGSTEVKLWNSDAVAYVVDSDAALYSQDHADVAGDLYIWGTYRGDGESDFWSYARDFDGSDLGGGSERVVDVHFATSSDLEKTSGSLEVHGAAGATTTIAAQGSGNYGLRVGGTASTSFEYYAVRDIDSSGLTFSGSPSVATLSRGDLEVSVNGGTAMTVGGSVISENPARTFTSNRFALAGVGSGSNVTATGTSDSSWRFTNHYGDLDGEANDVDPDGDPGYIAWDDSASLITVSGTVYSDEGSTVLPECSTGTNNITLRVAGLTSYTTDCDSTTGAYNISNVSYSPGDSLIVYIDNETAVGATVSEDPISNINGLDIYENRVIVRHEGTDPLSITDMAVWDSSDDGDIPFTAVTGSPDTLTLPSDTKLLLWSGKEFEPAGDVTLSGGGAGAAYDGTLELMDNADWTGAGTEQLSIGGSMILQSGATFEPGSGTTTFTTSGAGRTIVVNEEDLYNVAFTGSGSWSVSDPTLTVAGNALLTDGTLTLPSGTTTVSGSYVTNGGAFDANSGVMVFDGSGTHSIAGDGSDFADLRVIGSGDFTMSDTSATATASLSVTAGTLTLPSGSLAVGGDFRNEGGSVTHNTSELILTSGTGGTVLASSSDLYALTVQGAGSFTMADQSLTLLDSLSINNGSLTLATGTLSIGGSFDGTGGSFAHASGTILFNSSDGGETIDPGASNFYNVQIGAPAGGYTIAGNATTSNHFTLANANSFTVSPGVTLTVEGVFQNSVGGGATTWTGSTLTLRGGNEYSFNSKVGGGDRYDTLVIGPDSDLAAWNSAATTTTVDSSSSFYSQDHGAVDGALNIYGDYHIATTTEYWSYATDFDGADLSGSERAVTVSIASSATTTLSGGTLNIVGISGNETTITSQGIGTYDFNVTGGTLNAQYYEYRDLNANGLDLSGTPTISSLDNGDFELSVNSGTLISLSSTTLNANASFIISGTRFATTTAISGNNVTLTGSTANAWTFVSHTGNLSGEDYDVDGADACGSIRWDDSECLITQQTHYRWRHDDGGLGAPDSEWFNQNWDARKQVRLENPDSTTYTDAVVALTVTYDADMQADFDDLRFTDSSGTTTIPHWIGSTTNSTVTEVWVQVPELPGKDMVSIFMYYNHPTASSTSSSTQTFITADDFEDGTINEYSGQTAEFTVDGTYAWDGSYGLDATGNENGRTDQGGIYDLSRTVSQGETIRYLQYVHGETTNNDEVCTTFGIQSTGAPSSNYAVCTDLQGTERIVLARDVTDNADSGTVLASQNVDFTTGWYEVEIDWGTDDTIFVSMYDEGGSLFATTSASDSNYTSGGIGFTFWFQNGGWDSLSSRSTLGSEPTARFGAEQGDGGASWAAEQDVPATNFDPNDVARLRLAVENSGLSITDQEFLLEYAEQGAAPSCEAVDPGDFAAVPVQSSCGSSPVCMQGSSNVTNGASTVDLLSKTEGDYVAGEAREDPSNITGQLDLGQDTYTELEYVVTPTTNVSDPNLCFRATDNGSDYDTYLRVAKMNVRFEPSFGPVFFNDGNDISLTPGTTTRVYATSTVTDLNGYSDLVAGTSTMYTSSSSAACSDDNNDCYIETTGGQCSFTDCAGNSCTLECYSDLYFHANPTDNDGGLEWFAFLEAEDGQGDVGFNTSTGIELLTLRALEVNNSIDYGSLAANTDTGSNNATTTLQNTGNDAIDVEVEGDDLTDGGISTIPADEQKFATTTFTYTACAFCATVSTSTPTPLEVDLDKPITDSPPVADEVYWGIRVPIGTNSAPHQGTNIFYAVSDI